MSLRLTATILLILASPAYGQFTGQDVTPAGATAAGLTGSANGKSAGTHNGRAMVYDSGLNQTTDLPNPVGALTSVAKATDGVEEVGYAPVGYYNQCVVWNGSTGPAPVLLTPPTYLASWCLGTDGGSEIGWGWKASYIYSTEHAMMWYGNSNSSVDLHSGAGVYSRGRGIHGGEQVGEIDNSPSTDPDDGVISYARQAVLWHGTAASMVNLHPLGYAASAALATNGTQEGGWAAGVGTGIHAMMWSGSAASAVDLHPAGYYDSRVTALTGTMQVGDGWVGGAAHTLNAHRHALAWTGSAAGVIDLNSFIPLGYTDAVATGIDSAGNVVGYAFNTPTYGDHMPIDAIAVVFTSAPPPAWAISSLSLTPAVAHTGDTLIGLVTLSNPAPAGGATVSFASGTLALVPAPADVLVPEGQTNVSFVASTLQSPITLVTPVTVIGITGSARKQATVTFQPVAKLSTMTVSSVLQGGNQTNGTITLNIPAPVPVTVAVSADSSALTVPAFVTFGVGQSSQSFVVTAAIATAPASGTVTAAFNGNILTALVNITASVPSALSSITLPPAVGGTTFTGTVTLNHPAYVGGSTVSLSTSDAILAPVPATITIPYGAISGTFSGTAGSVASQGTATLTASLNGASLSGIMTVTSLGVSSVTVPAVLGGQSFMGTVALNHSAPVGGVTISLSTSDATLAPVPATLTIPAGAISATFSGTAGTGASHGTATIAASFNGASASGILTVTALGVSSVTLPAAAGGGTFTGTVTLNYPAPAGGAVVSLTTTDPNLAPVPPTLSIPAGYSSATFTGIAGTAASQGSATIKATLNGSSVSGTLTVVTGPGAAIQSLDYWTVSQLIKVTATTTMPAGTLSFGLTQNGPALGILTLEATTGLYQGSAKMSKAPSTIWVWNSFGGTAVSSSSVRSRSK